MKICFIAPANNYHTQKWANWFREHGHVVHVVSFINSEIPGVTVHFIDTGASAESNDISKLKYLLHARDLKMIVKKIAPDIVNVHYATSYGTVAALSGIEGYVLSVWGTDIYEFPQKSIFHKMMLKYSLYKATWLFSTSNAMAVEAKKYTNKDFEITPFGVDMKLFNPAKRHRTDDKKLFVLGTIKKLTPKYGIDYLIRAVAEVRRVRPDIPIQLRIAGNGVNEKEYRDLALKEGIDDITQWLGFITQKECALEWANMDVAIIPSISESFGVSAVEAQASGIPLIISDVPGLLEATSRECSVVVKRMNVIDIRDAIVALYENNTLRDKYGFAGRKYVVDNFELNQCFERIQSLFERYAYEKGKGCEI